ncbi:hypothetical protein ABH920_004104 [Catenulispora sp. EB89]
MVYRRFLRLRLRFGDLAGGRSSVEPGWLRWRPPVFVGTTARWSDSRCGALAAGGAGVHDREAVGVGASDALAAGGCRWRVLYLFIRGDNALTKCRPARLAPPGSVDGRRFSRPRPRTGPSHCARVWSGGWRPRLVGASRPPAGTLQRGGDPRVLLFGGGPRLFGSTSRCCLRRAGRWQSLLVVAEVLGPSPRRRRKRNQSGLAVSSRIAAAVVRPRSAGHHRPGQVGFARRRGEGPRTNTPHGPSDPLATWPVAQPRRHPQPPRHRFSPEPATWSHRPRSPLPTAGRQRNPRRSAELRPPARSPNLRRIRKSPLKLQADRTRAAHRAPASAARTPYSSSAPFSSQPPRRRTTAR